MDANLKSFLKSQYVTYFPFEKPPNKKTLKQFAECNPQLVDFFYQQNPQARYQPTETEKPFKAQANNQKIDWYSETREYEEWPCQDGDETKPLYFDRKINTYRPAITEKDKKIAGTQRSEYLRNLAQQGLIASFDEKYIYQRGTNYNPQIHDKLLWEASKESPFPSQWPEVIGISYVTMMAWVEIYPNTFGAMYDSIDQKGNMLQWGEGLIMKMINDKNYPLRIGEVIKILERKTRDEWGPSEAKELANAIKQVVWTNNKNEYNATMDQQWDVTKEQVFTIRPEDQFSNNTASNVQRTGAMA